jgi:hypothetical protein
MIVGRRRVVTVEPWIIEQLEEEERRRREDEEARRSRIELPQTAPAEERDTTGTHNRALIIVDISPPGEKRIDI